MHLERERWFLLVFAKTELRRIRLEVETVEEIRVFLTRSGTVGLEGKKQLVIMFEKP